MKRGKYHWLAVFLHTVSSPHPSPCSLLHNERTHIHTLFSTGGRLLTCSGAHLTPRSAQCPMSLTIPSETRQNHGSKPDVFCSTPRCHLAARNRVALHAACRCRGSLFTASAGCLVYINGRPADVNGMHVCTRCSRGNITVSPMVYFSKGEGLVYVCVMIYWWMAVLLLNLQLCNSASIWSP